MAMPVMLGRDYLNHVWKGTGGKLKNLVKPLLKDGIGDKMDKGNLWVVPGFTLLVFAILWTTKLSKIALDESECRGASVYDFTGTKLDEDAKKHCQTAKRYYVGPNEQFSLDYEFRIRREVKNPEWILWFWGPIVFVMYVLTRFVWSLLMENQGVNYPNVVSAAQSVTVDNNGISEIDEEKLLDRLGVVAENFRTAYSSRAFAAFMTFEISLVVAPLVLLLFVLPLMVGSNYRTWGLDIARAWWEGRDWQGSPLVPFFDVASSEGRSMLVPLIPRITYCDYHFVTLGNTHSLTYRCYLDANWHERTALFTWIMLIFLTSINLGNLVFWIEWAVRMRSRKQRRAWVTKKWLNPDGFNEAELALMLRFAEGFKMGQLLYFYYIEAHTDRVVASAFCTALFGRWLERKRRQRHSIASPMDNSYMMDGPPQGGEGVPADSQVKPSDKMSPPGWKHLYSQTMPYPTAPFATPPYGSFMYTGDRTPTRKGHSHHSPATQTPKTSEGAAPPLELGAQMPCTSALVGSMKARCPNMAAEVGRDSAGGRRSDRRLSRGQLARMEKHDEEEVEALTAAEPECRVTTVEQPKTQPEKKQSPPVQQRKGSGKEQKGGNQTPTKTAPPAQSGKFEQTGFGNQQSGFGNQKKVSGQENNNSKKKTPTPDPEEGEIENDAWS